ncbi:8-oxo-dGTP diphosphatase [bacterium A37T11]|nr:8-oxo-dGTP diphosphatase [bacterium A37T11]
MSYSYKYPHFALTVDAVIFSKNGSGFWDVLLIQRKHAPFEGQWAFPGGFVEPDELLDDAVLRELKEETGVTGVSFKRLGVYDALDRDPRERTISMAYVGLADRDLMLVQAADDAADARWFSVDALPLLAFDHARVLNDALGLVGA